MQRWKQPGVRAVVVSIHDVRPGVSGTVGRMLADLAAAGVPVTALLVVPHWHRADPAFGNPAFCDWLLARQGEGHELVLHGYYHQRVAANRATFWQGLVGQFYTAGEGEFYDAGEAQCGDLLECGISALRALTGKVPAGFIAPAWLLGDGARAALARHPFEYTTLLGGVWDLRAGGSAVSHTGLLPGSGYRSTSLCYSVRAAWRRLCSLGWNSLLLHRMRSGPLVRISLHPPDWEFPAIRRHALRAVQLALAGRPAMTYENWIEQQRHSTAQ